jgi:hypothetical protein
MMYKFLGKPDRIFPDLVTGKVYDLTVIEKSKGPLGCVAGNTHPQIVSPIRCPYRSWDTFYANWERVI